MDNKVIGIPILIGLGGISAYFFSKKKRVYFKPFRKSHYHSSKRNKKYFSPKNKPMKGKIFGIPILLIIAGVAAYIFREKIAKLFKRNEAYTPTEK